MGSYRLRPRIPLVPPKETLILVIPALPGLVGEEQLGTNRDLVYKEDQFYIIAIAVLLLTFPLAAIYNPIPP